MLSDIVTSEVEFHDIEIEGSVALGELSWT